MSDESISHREDKENLLYLFRKINLEEYQVGEDACQRESIVSCDSVLPKPYFESDINLLNAIGKQIGPEIFNNPETVAKIKPFDFIWTFGINSKNGLINLTTENRKEILFSSSHLPILYNYCTKEMRCLEGHQYLVNSISSDISGKWLATADDHVDGCVIIWDSIELNPVFTLFNIYPLSGALLVKLSSSAKYLITIGIKNEGNYSVDFWLWTLGNETPEDTFNMDKSFGVPVKICFNPNIEEFVMIIFKKEVLLLVWDEEKKRFSNNKIARITHRNKIGNLTTGTYISNCHECYACSSKGCLLIIGNTLYAKPYEEGELDNSKIFINALKVSQYAIRSCTATASSVVIGDASGSILFFDRTIKLLYWFKKFSLGPIVSISFNLIPKHKKEDELTMFTVKPRDSHIFECGYSDYTEELEKIFKIDLPKEASLRRDPFLETDFFVATSDSNVYAIDFLNKTCVPIFLVADDYVSAIEIHSDFSYLVIGYANGRIHLVDYQRNEVICTTMIPKTEDCVSISCLKYSPESIHLVCGRENGEIWILDPIILEPKINQPFRPTKNKVKKIVFSKNMAQFAYYDIDKTVVLFVYHTDICSWKFAGKIRSHYDDICDIMFMPNHPSSTLYTIALDRHLVEYNNKTLEDDFGIAGRERIEQKAIPMSFMYWSETVKDTIRNDYFLIADNQHKFKLIEPVTKIPKTTVLAPAFGCFKNQTICKMQIVPKTEERYMVFLTSKHIGLHIMLPDGNPYKYVGYLGHPTQVEDVLLSPDGKYIFSFGTEDHCVFKWQINFKAVELTHLLGGKELEPFYCLIEGGKNGWLFQEIKDLFYYMQILQQETIDLPRRISDNINVSELPELVRTCGFYPSEFELENMMIDIKYRNYQETGQLNSEISFIDFVKLFCNHKPAYGYNKESLRNAFQTLVQNAESSESDDQMSREEFASMLEHTGEYISPGNLQKFFKTLMRFDQPAKTLEFLPETIDFKTFYEEILGIDIGRSKMMDGESNGTEEE